MSTNKQASYVLPNETKLPRHLKDRSPYRFPNTEIILRQALEQATTSEGQVIMSGAIEFQTQIRPGVLADICDPWELFKALTT